MSAYDDVVSTFFTVTGFAATAALLWAAFTDDGREEHVDEYGQPLDPAADDDGPDDQLARITLGARFTDHTLPSGVSPLWTVRS